MKLILKVSVISLGLVGCQNATNTTPASLTPAAVDDGVPAVAAGSASNDDEVKVSDDDLTSSIRDQISGRKMSVNVQNIKIVTQKGRVTLLGVVKTNDEKKQIEEIAHTVAGAQNVWSQLEVE